MGAIVLYDLVGADERRFSSHCWRIRPALVHKGLDYETIPTPFTSIPAVGDGSFPTLPIIRDGDRWVCDSGVIAEYLEVTYPDRPSLFGGAAGQALTAFVSHWWRGRMHLFVMPMILEDIHSNLVPEDQDWFAISRKKRFGTSIAELAEGREERRVEFRERLEPLRQLLAGQRFLGGETPLYADYLVMGTFIWARKMSPFALVEPGDPVHDWMNRCLDLYDGMARSGPGYDW